MPTPQAADPWADLDAAAARAAAAQPASNPWADLDAVAARAAAAPAGLGAAGPSQGRAPVSWADLDAAATQAMPQYDPTSGMSPLDRFTAGVGRGLMNVVRHIGLVTGLESPADYAESKRLDAPLMNTTAGQVGNFVGESAPLVALTGGMGAAADAAAGLGRAGMLAARVGGSALTQGAAQGALMADPGQRLQGAAVGAVGGALAPALKYLGSKAISGISRTPEAQQLLDAGASLTPGQLNPTGPLSRMEQAATALPGVGDALTNARVAAQRDYVRAQMQRSMPPGTALDPDAKTINQMVADASNKFADSYSVVKGLPVQAAIATPGAAPVPLEAALAAVVSKARPGMTAADAAATGENLQQLLGQQIASAREAGRPLMSDDLLGFRSQVRDLIRGEPGDTNASRAARSLYQDAEKQVTNTLNSQLPPAAAQALANTDAQYAKFAILRNAAAAAKDNPNGPTPYQVATAIAQGTNKNAYAAGGGLNRDLSQAAMSTFQADVPKTGLSGMGRLALPAALLSMTPWGKAAGALVMSHPVAMVPPGLAAWAALTPSGRAAIAGNTAAQKLLSRGVQAAGAAIPQSVKNLVGQSARVGVVNTMTPRLEQMQDVPQPSGDAAASADSFLRQLNQVEAARMASQAANP